MKLINYIFTHWPVILFTSFIISSFIWSIFGMNRQSERFYRGLDEIWEKARQAKTKEELKIIYQEYKDYYDKYAVCRQYAEYSRRLKYYIDGKYAGMNTIKIIS